MRILVAEDEKSLSNALVKIFKNNSYEIDAVFNGEDALDYIETGRYDAVVLDIMMPKMDGITVLKKVRQNNNKTPIIMLTAKSEIDDIVLGLDSGANDYLSKPFDTKELLARIRAITRSQEEIEGKLKIGNVALDVRTHELISPKTNCHLANKEFQLLEIFMKNPNVIFSSEQLFIKVWGYDTESNINVLWVYISYIRNKLQTLDANIQIKVSRNSGYSLEILND